MFRTIRALMEFLYTTMCLCTFYGKTAESPTNIFKTWLIYELQTEMGVWGLVPNHNVNLYWLCCIYIIHDESPNHSRVLVVLCVVGDSAGGSILFTTNMWALSIITCTTCSIAHCHSILTICFCHILTFHTLNSLFTNCHAKEHYNLLYKRALTTCYTKGHYNLLYKRALQPVMQKAL